jgi:hypothetical protein
MPWRTWLQRNYSSFDGVGCGITTIDTLKRLAGEGKGEMLGSTLPIRNLPYVHPDYSLESVLRHVYHEPLVPVVHRAPISGDRKE